MAYANLIAQSCNNPIETFLRFRDFICKRNGTYDYSSTGVGWTLHDSVYAIDEDTISINDYFVIYSAGEDGQRDMYFQVKYISSYISILGYLYWNNTTHTGVIEFGQYYFWYNPAATNNVFWLYADLDGFYGISKYNTTYYFGMGGWMPDSSIDQTITVASNAITAGSSVTVTFTAVPAGWAVGTYLFVKDLANIEQVKITVISGLAVTFQTFVNSYTAGSKFCLENTVFCGLTLQITHNGTKNLAITAYLTTLPGPTSGDYLNGLYPTQKYYCYNANTFIGPLPHILVTISLTGESTHTLDLDGYRYFYLSSFGNTLLSEV